MKLKNGNSSPSSINGNNKNGNSLSYGKYIEKLNYDDEYDNLKKEKIKYTERKIGIFLFIISFFILVGKLFLALSKLQKKIFIEI